MGNGRPSYHHISAGNAIEHFDEPDQTSKKVKSQSTPPKRKQLAKVEGARSRNLCMSGESFRCRVAHLHAK